MAVWPREEKNEGRAMEETGKQKRRKEEGRERGRRGRGRIKAMGREVGEGR